MPLIRYFVFTGGALLALLYLADYYMAGPVSAAAETAPDLSITRIHSAQTWPEKIVFDTSVRQIPLTKTAASSASDAAAPPAAPEGTRQAFAMVAQSAAESKAAESKAAESKAAESKQATPAAPKKRVAERHRRRQPLRMAARGFFNEPVAAGW
jgi:uncharacterized low-complexity protein